MDYTHKIKLPNDIPRQYIKLACAIETGKVVFAKENIVSHVGMIGRTSVYIGKGGLMNEDVPNEWLIEIEPPMDFEEWNCQRDFNEKTHCLKQRVGDYMQNEINECIKSERETAWDAALKQDRLKRGEV